MKDNAPKATAFYLLWPGYCRDSYSHRVALAGLTSHRHA